YGDLLLLLLGELGPVALFIERDCLTALLDESLHHPLNVALLDTAGITLAARVDVALLECSHDHADCGDAALVACLHRLLERGGESVAQRHQYRPPRRNRS